MAAVEASHIVGSEGRHVAVLSIAKIARVPGAMGIGVRAVRDVNARDFAILRIYDEKSRLIRAQAVINKAENIPPNQPIPVGVIVEQRFLKQRPAHIWNVVLVRINITIASPQGLFVGLRIRGRNPTH